MPDLSPMRIGVESEDGVTKFECTASVYVSKEGEFRVSLDDRLVSIAEKMPQPCVSIECPSNSKTYKVCGKALGHITTFIRDCAREYLACKTETTRVILYGHRLDIAVWINKDGSLAPNGCNALKGGEWFKGSGLTSSRTAPSYSVGLFAAVFDKTTYIRKSGNTVTWEAVNDPKDEAANKLNAFTCLRINPQLDSHTEMPYTPEAALFFYNMLLGLCALAVQIDSFFSTPGKLALAIGLRAQLGPPTFIASPPDET